MKIWNAKLFLFIYRFFSHYIILFPVRSFVSSREVKRWSSSCASSPPSNSTFPLDLVWFDCFWQHHPVPLNTHTNNSDVVQQHLKKINSVFHVCKWRAAASGQNMEHIHGATKRNDTYLIQNLRSLPVLSYSSVFISIFLCALWNCKRYLQPCDSSTQLISIVATLLRKPQLIYNVPFQFKMETYKLIK